MTTIEDTDAPTRIAEAGRRRALARLREALHHQTATHPELGEIEPATLDRLAEEAVDRAGASLWRISLAEGAADEYGVAVSEALAHPAVAAAQGIVDPPAEPVAPSPEAVIDEPGAAAGEPETSPEPGFEPPQPDPAAEVWPPDAEVERETVEAGAEPLRVPAVHTSGIETLKAGDKDIELRLSDAGLDVIKRSSGVAIGRLEWSEITAIDVEAVRRRGRRRRSQTLQVRTARGQATFELPGLTDEDAATHLHPMLERLGGTGTLDG